MFFRHEKTSKQCGDDIDDRVYMWLLVDITDILHDENDSENCTNNDNFGKISIDVALCRQAPLGTSSGISTMVSGLATGVLEERRSTMVCMMMMMQKMSCINDNPGTGVMYLAGPHTVSPRAMNI